MRISEIINELKKIKEANGDLDCYLIGDYVGSDPVNLIKVYGTKCIIFNEKDSWVRPKKEKENDKLTWVRPKKEKENDKLTWARPKKEKENDKLTWADYEEEVIRKMAFELPFEEILKMLEDKFRYGVIEYRDDGLIEISPQGWSEDEQLLCVLNDEYSFRKHCIGSIESTLFYVKDINDRWDKNYDIIENKDD